MNTEFSLSPHVPAPRSCGACIFSYLDRPDPKVLQTQRFCRRFPPNGQMIATQAGMALASLHPPVQDADWCFEFSPKVEQN